MKKANYKLRITNNIFIGILITIFFTAPVFAQDEAALAKKLSNPIAALISVPIQVNYDDNYGAADQGSVWKTNVQPVIPFTLSENWNLISRTILPIINQDDIPLEGMGESGIGDIIQSFFFSPQEPTSGGLIWGVGPVLLIPAASDEMLGGEKWGAGPTGVALKQSGPWTIGALVNHIWSFEGEDDRDDISATWIQPFVSYITKTKTTINLNSESSYDWENEQWSVPVNFMVLQMLKIGPQIIQAGGGIRYWAESPDGGPEDWAARLQLTFLFPK